MSPNGSLLYATSRRRSLVVARSLLPRELETERVDRAGPGRDDHALRLEVELKRVEPQLAAEARLLVPADRDPWERGIRHVDPDRPRLDTCGDAVAARRVAGPDRRHQPVADVVRDADRV